MKTPWNFTWKLLRAMEHDGSPWSFHVFAHVEFHEKSAVEFPWKIFHEKFSREFHKV